MATKVSLYCGMFWLSRGIVYMATASTGSTNMSIESSSSSTTAEDCGAHVKIEEDFLNSGRTGRRNAIPDIYCPQSRVSTAELPGNFARLSCEGTSSFFFIIDYFVLIHIIMPYCYSDYTYAYINLFSRIWPKPSFIEHQSGAQLMIEWLHSPQILIHFARSDPLDDTVFHLSFHQLLSWFHSSVLIYILCWVINPTASFDFFFYICQTQYTLVNDDEVNIWNRSNRHDHHRHVCLPT